MLPIYRQHFAETAFTTKPNCSGLFYDIKFCCGTAGRYAVRLTEGSILDRRHSHLFSGCSGFIPRRQSGWGVKLTTYLHLMLRWRIGGATPLLLLFPFMSCTETAFLYLL